MRDDIQQLLEQFKQSQERSAQSPAGFTEEEVNELQGQPTPPMQAPEVDETPLSALRPPEGEAPQGPPPVNAELEAALQRRADMEQKAAMLRGFQTMVKGATGFDADMTMADQLAKRGQREVDEYQAGQKAQREAEKQKQADELGKIQIGKAEYEFTNLKKTSDPTSPESKLAQDMYIEHAKATNTPVNEETIRQIAAKDLHANSKFLQDKLAQMMREKQAMQTRADTERRHQEREAGREQRSARNLEERQIRRKFSEDEQEKERKRKLSKDITDRFDKIKTNKVWQKLDDQGLTFAQADGLIEEIEKGNEVALGALGTKMARSMGEVGVLTNEDVQRYIEAQSVVQKAKDKFGKAFMGQLSDQTLKDIKDINAKMKKGFAIKRAAVVKEYVDQTYENFGKDAGMTRDDVMRRMGFKVKSAETKDAKESEGEIKRRTKDGRTAVFDANKKFLRYED